MLRPVLALGRKTWLATGVAAATLAVAAPAGAQVSQVDELVVTARKVEERLQDVPIAVSAFTGESLERKQAQNLIDVAEFTPGVQIQQGFGRDGDRPVFRGTSNILTSDAKVGIFVDGMFAGEININSVHRGPFQSAYIGYWIDERHAGKGYTPEAVVLVLRFAFEQMLLHRLQISVIPRNVASRRVVEKLGLRNEGIAERYLAVAEELRKAIAWHDGRATDHLAGAEEGRELLARHGIRLGRPPMP